MELKNTVQVKFPHTDKIISVADADCPMTQVHDHGWALVNYAMMKMKEAQEAQEKKEECKKDSE